MTDPRIIPPGEVLPPMDLGERPARRNRRTPTDAEPKRKRKPGRGSGAVRRRFALLNAFIDVALPRLGPVDVAVWLVLYRHGQRDGTAPAAVSDLARRTGHRNAAVRLALRRIVAECGFTRLRDLTRESVERWAATVRRAGMSARTVNAHLAALIAFANWAVAVGRLLGNPLARLPKLDERADQRRPRRAMTGDELRRLLTVARLRPLAEYGRPTVKLADAGKRENKRSRRTWTRAPLTFGGLQTAADRARVALAKRPDFIAELERRGRERALIYKTLVLTGLRLGELRSLTVGKLELDGRVAFAVLDASDEKAGRRAEIPLRPDLVADLHDWLGRRLDAARAAARAKQLPLPARLPDDAPLFDVPPNLSSIFNRDLRAASIPKRDDRGRVLDVHALRHTFGTHLSKGGVAPRVAKRR